MDKVKKAEKLFKDGYSCSQAILLSYADEFGLDKDQAAKISATFGGGMGRLRKTCGAITGAFMVLGLKYGNSDPEDMDTKLKSYEKVRKFAKIMEDKHSSVECKVILKNNASKSEVEKRQHHRKICDQVVYDSATLLEEFLKD